MTAYEPHIAYIINTTGDEDPTMMHQLEASSQEAAATAAVHWLQTEANADLATAWRLAPYSEWTAPGGISFAGFYIRNTDQRAIIRIEPIRDQDESPEEGEAPEVSRKSDPVAPAPENAITHIDQLDRAKRIAAVLDVNREARPVLIGIIGELIAGTISQDDLEIMHERLFEIDEEGLAEYLFDELGAPDVRADDPTIYDRSTH